MASICCSPPDSVPARWRPARAGAETAEHVLDAGLDLALVEEEAAHLQVLGHRQRREHAPALGRDGDALAHDVVRGQVGDVPAVQQDVAAAGARAAAHRHQQRGLAGAVGADQRDDLALVDVQADLVDGADGAVVGAQLPELQHARHHSSPR
jgi:hypothetical protein